MTSIYFEGAVRLKSHSATTKGGKSTIKIELETNDHFDLASILRQLDEIDRAQRERSKPARKTPAPSAKQEPLGLPAPLLRIADHRETGT